MFRSIFTFIVLLGLGAFVVGCQQEEATPENEISSDVLNKIQAMGFSTEGIVKFGENFIVETDILITPEFLESGAQPGRIPELEQYATNNLVSTGGSRTITIGYSESRSSRFKPLYDGALRNAVSRFNNLNLEINFQIVDGDNADIAITRFPPFFELFGVLGSAGFPSAGGDPFGSISLNGELDLYFGIDQAGIATIIAHEMGHCIGFRHTDYFDRSISCGGAAQDEGDGGVGANLIPGTPAGADLEGNGSWMLACTDGSNRLFTTFDKVALDFLY